MSVQVLHDERPTARKRHLCDDCGRSIQRGEVYRRCDLAGDGYRYSWKTCAHCRVLVHHIYRVEGGWYYTDDGLDVAEWINCNEQRDSRLAVLFRSRWEGITPDELRAILAPSLLVGPLTDDESEQR